MNGAVLCRPSSFVAQVAPVDDHDEREGHAVVFYFGVVFARDWMDVAFVPEERHVDEDRTRLFRPCA